MFARFDENPAMNLQDIKETKRYEWTDGRTHARTDARMDGQRENSILPTNRVCGGYNKLSSAILSLRGKHQYTISVNTYLNSTFPPLMANEINCPVPSSLCEANISIPSLLILTETQLCHHLWLMK